MALQKLELTTQRRRILEATEDGCWWHPGAMTFRRSRVPSRVLDEMVAGGWLYRAWVHMPSAKGFYAYQLTSLGRLTLRRASADESDNETQDAGAAVEVAD
jgi:hypothetical protein